MTENRAHFDRTTCLSVPGVGRFGRQFLFSPHPGSMDLNKLGEPTENVASRSCHCGKENRTWIHLKPSSQGCRDVEFWRAGRWCTQQKPLKVAMEGKLPWPASKPMVRLNVIF